MKSSRYNFNKKFNNMTKIVDSSNLNCFKKIIILKKWDSYFKQLIKD